MIGKQNSVELFPTYYIRPSGVIHIRVNLEVWILHTVRRTPWMGLSNSLYVFIDYCIYNRINEMSAQMYAIIGTFVFLYRTSMLRRLRK